jgi:hypothetical protein
MSGLGAWLAAQQEAERAAAGAVAEWREVVARNTQLEAAIRRYQQAQQAEGEAATVERLTARAALFACLDEVAP